MSSNLCHPTKVLSDTVVEETEAQMKHGVLNKLFTHKLTQFVLTDLKLVMYSYIWLYVAYLPRIRCFNIILKPRWCDWANHASSQTRTCGPHDDFIIERCSLLGCTWALSFLFQQPFQFHYRYGEHWWLQGQILEKSSRQPGRHHRALS